MKKMLVLILLNSTLFAQTIPSSIPLALQKKLCDQLANGSNRCDNGSTLSYYKHAKLEGERLLIFISLNEHTAHPNPHLHSAIPVMVDARGRWISTVGENSISETIDSIHEDPKGNVWVKSQWQIEGVHPAFYHSTDGLKWKRTILPSNRDVDCCFEEADEPRFLHNSIALTFRDLNGKIEKTWLASYQSAMSNHPIWQPLTHIPLNTIEMLPNNHWQVTNHQDVISFFNTYSKKRVSLTINNKRDKKHYKIQLGAYQKMASAKMVKNSLNYLDYGLEIVQGKKYVKLYMESFTSYQKANFILKKLKRQYPKNKTIQKAFILTSKAQ
jgi:hypothetical protein